MTSPDSGAGDRGRTMTSPDSGAGDPLEVAVRRAGFAALLDGRCLTLDELAEASGVAREVAAEVAGALVAAGRATMTDDGRLDGIAGLTTRPTRHAIERPGASPAGAGAAGSGATVSGPAVAGSAGPEKASGRIATWCAYDAVAVPAALGWTATAVTTCGSCGADLRVALQDGVPSGDAWGWLPPGECEHVLRDFCASADLFCSRAHLDAWRRAAGDPPGEPHPVNELADLGRDAWANCLPSGEDSRHLAT